VVALFASQDGNALDASAREEAHPIEPCYEDALRAVEADPNNLLMVAEVEGAVVGVFQLTIIQHVAFRGGRVAQIENVFVDDSARGRGVGTAMMQWAIDLAKRRGCFRVQLTTNRARTRAHAFYERLGFVASHVGMKRTV